MSNITVLIVEDEVASDGRPLESRLTKHGYEVIAIAETADQAIAICRERRPQVVLMDIQLRNPTTRAFDDLAGARAGRTIQEDTGAQIIYVTGWKIEERLLDEVCKTHDFQFLRKPVSDEQLFASMRLDAMKVRKRTIVFLCYSHNDHRYATELEKFFKPLGRHRY